MGCQASTPVLQNDNLDDSLHKRLIQDKNRKVDDIYTREKQIAHGTGSKIVVVKNKKFVKTQHSGYAMKIYDGVSELPPDLVHEAEILQMCDHPNIVKLFEIGKVKKGITLVMEYCTGGTVESHFPYSEKESSKILWQLISAVDYLHKKSIVHRDINLSNIMFEQDPIRDENNKDRISNVKLLDFGCATKLHYWSNGAFKGNVKFLSEVTGGIYTMAPEVIDQKYTTQADMWSVGVCAYILMTDGIKPFDSNSGQLKAIQTKIKCNAVDYSLIKSKKAVTFIKKCLTTNPASRITASKALRDPWIIQTKEKIIMPNSLIAAFQQFMRCTPVKRIAYNILARKADSKQIMAYRDIFRNLDVTHSNTLTRVEFVTGFTSSGFSEEELEDLFTKLDINCNDEILYTEFMAGTMADDEIDEQQLLEAFEQMDVDNSGYVSKKNLLSLLGNSQSVKDSGLAATLKNFKQLSFHEFRALFAENHLDRSLHAFEEIHESDESEEDDF